MIPPTVGPTTNANVQQASRHPIKRAVNALCSYLFGPTAALLLLVLPVSLLLVAVVAASLLWPLVALLATRIEADTLVPISAKYALMTGDAPAQHPASTRRVKNVSKEYPRETHFA